MRHFLTGEGRRRVVVAIAILAIVAGCGSDPDGGSARSSSVGAPSDDTDPGRCVVRLHGKGAQGADPVVEGGIRIVSPDGNAEAWGGREWRYFPDDDYRSAVGVVEDSIASCAQVIVNGFSNGGAFAAKLYCRGETFGGRLTHVVVDDPVVDGAVENCSPDPNVGVTLYWTGALESQAQPGWDCSEADWTCEGGRTIGITTYAWALGVDPTDSPHDDHQWFLDAPELSIPR